MIAKFYYIFIISLFLYASCHRTSLYDNEVEGKIIKYDRYSNGIIKSEIPFKDDSILDGFFKTYYMDGHLQKVVQYKNGKKEGIEREFYPNGNIEYEVKNKDDKANGIIRSFRETGIRRAEYSLFDDRYFGRQLDFDSNGNLELVRFTNLEGKLLFKYKPISESNFYYEGSPVYVAYNTDKFKRGEKIEIIYNFISPPDFVVRLSLDSDNSGLIDLSKRIDTTYYSYRYVFSEKVESIGKHDLKFILNMTYAGTHNSINDTSEIRFDVIP